MINSYRTQHRDKMSEKTEQDISVLELIEPQDKIIPVIFDSPHSGRSYPEDFDFACDFDVLKRAEDNYVEEFFSHAPKYGATFLHALFPRTYIDVNRARNDIDPDLLDGEWCKDTILPTTRSHAGIGLIRRLVKPGVPLYNRKLSIKEIDDRISTYYDPYHNLLSEKLEHLHYNFGQVWHINCHSMPSQKNRSRSLRGTIHFLSEQPDFVLGDRDGTSCHADFTRSIRAFLKDLGYKVAINNPYRGVEIVRRYGAPTTGRHSLQLEINKALYWDEQSHKKTNNFENLQENLDKLIEFITNYAESSLVDLAAD